MTTTTLGTARDRLLERAARTGARVDELESTPHHRNSFMPYRPLPDGPDVELAGERLLLMSGYSYLGLAHDPRLADAAHTAIRAYGAGAHGVRALAGSTPLHTELEEQLARMLGRESAVAMGSGYATNVGVIGAICGPGDTIVADKLVHASIVDGCRLSGASVTRFRHNDAAHLEQRLAQAPTDGLRLVIVDSVYSMDGDIAPLPELREVCDRHDALLMVDEAHALGVIGERGLGIEEHFDMVGSVDIKVGTLSKAIPSVGGWVVGDATLTRHLRYSARPFLFSAALPPAQTAIALEALRILEGEPERVQHIQRESTRFRAAMRAAGVDVGASETAVVPLIIGTDLQAYDAATRCREQGVVGIPVVTPAVPSNQARLRIALTAAHRRDDVDRAIDVFTRVCPRSSR